MIVAAVIGSSPRTWGTLASIREAPGSQRFIPTHMGNATSPTATWCPRTVHPHAHGERRSFGHRFSFARGSSPRTWGTRWPRASGGVFRRFIPTHMGNAGAPARGRRGPTVHPHAHGERDVAAVQAACAFGSSPRTWGTPGNRAPGQRGHRFIPTHMGNATQPDTFRRSVSVHPHAHGERSIPGSSGVSSGGSSPRTWGTPGRARSPVDQTRFIPTHMGNARAATSPTRPTTVHPHAHGERSVLPAAPSCTNGSSPRTWGTLSAGLRRAAAVRFIPTHMGNATGVESNCSKDPVHPHAHGERKRIRTSATISRGSSPRTWGTPLRHLPRPLWSRFIPTHMGNARMKPKG